MKWTEVKIAANPSGVPYIEAVLVNNEVPGWQTEDAEEMRAFFRDNPRSWDYIDERVFEGSNFETVAFESEEHEFESRSPMQRGLVSLTFYLTGDESGRAKLQRITDEIENLRENLRYEFGEFEIYFAERDDDEWAENWKKYFKPVEIGENIVVRPAWEEYFGDGKTVITVNPGHVFGTGQHETTRMCIEAIEKHLKPGDKFLDLGCGSGILSVTALALGAKDAAAIDFDPGAGDIANENASLNGFGDDKLTVIIGDIYDPDLQIEIGKNKYGCVVANITADAIISITRVTAESWLGEGGAFIVSGIILSRAAEVRDELKKTGLSIIETRVTGEWVCIVCRNSF